MSKLVIEFPAGKSKSLGPLYSDAESFLSDAIAIHWEDDDTEPQVNAERPRFYHPKYSVPQAIMSHFTPSGEFTRQLAQDWIEKEGFARPGAGAALAKLVEFKYVKKIGPSRYSFIKAMDLSEKINL